MHPFRDGAPLLPLIETRETYRCSLCVFPYITHEMSPSCFATCGHHPSPRITIVFSLLSTAVVHRTSPRHIRLFSSSPPLTHSAPPCTSHIFHYVSYTLNCFATKASPCIYILLLSATGIPLSPFWLVQVPYTKSQIQRFRVVHWAVHIRLRSDLRE